MKTIYQILLVFLFFCVANTVDAQIESSSSNVTAETAEQQSHADANANPQEENANSNEAQSNASTQQVREPNDTKQNSEATQQAENRNTERTRQNNTSVQESISERHSPSINISHSVQLVPQRTNVSCWAASAAMIVGWRDNVSIDPAEIARGTGYWKTYYRNGGLPADDVNMFYRWGLSLLPAQTRTVEGFAQELESGPLWVGTDGGTMGHVIVVAAMRGDGTPDGTLVTIYDPWQRGMRTFTPTNRGSIYTETYTQFVARQERLINRTGANPNILYLAH